MGFFLFTKKIKGWHNLKTKNDLKKVFVVKIFYILVLIFVYVKLKTPNIWIGNSINKKKPKLMRMQNVLGNIWPQMKNCYLSFFYIYLWPNCKISAIF